MKKSTFLSVGFVGVERCIKRFGYENMHSDHLYPCMQLSGAEKLKFLVIILKCMGLCLIEISSGVLFYKLYLKKYEQNKSHAHLDQSHTGCVVPVF